MVAEEVDDGHLDRFIALEPEVGNVQQDADPLRVEPLPGAANRTARRCA